jgi:flagellar basal-body rod protein FlgB
MPAIAALGANRKTFKSSRMNLAMSLFDLIGSTSTDAAQHVIAFTRERQKVLADNLANIDTPGYRTRDLSIADFNSALQRAVTGAARDNRGRLAITADQAGQGAAQRSAAAGSSDAAKLRGLVFHDGNDRSIEQLVIAMTKNATMQNQAVSMLRTQLRLLRTIISENSGA